MILNQNESMRDFTVAGDGAQGCDMRATQVDVDATKIDGQVLK